MNESRNAGELLREFGKEYRLKITRDECNDPIIRGSRGNLYEYSANQIGLMMISDEGHPRLWNIVREKCLEAGMILHHNGDGEGSFSFDPANDVQARLAIKSAGVCPKKRISEEHKARLLEGLRNHEISGFQRIQQGGSGC